MKSGLATLSGIVGLAVLGMAAAGFGTQLATRGPAVVVVDADISTRLDANYASSPAGNSLAPLSAEVDSAAAADEQAILAPRGTSDPRIRGVPDTAGAAAARPSEPTAQSTAAARKGTSRTGNPSTDPVARELPTPKASSPRSNETSGPRAQVAAALIVTGIGLLIVAVLLTILNRFREHRWGRRRRRDPEPDDM